MEIGITKHSILSAQVYNPRTGSFHNVERCTRCGAQGESRELLCQTSPDCVIMLQEPKNPPVEEAQKPV